MMKAFLTLCHDESGYIASAELVMIATIAVLAMVVGLSDVALAVNHELGDVAIAFGTVNQSYRYAGLTGSPNTSNGSQFQNAVDFCDAATSFSSSMGTSQNLASSKLGF